MKKFLSLFVLVCTMALAVGCSGSDDYIKVGAVGPYTGDLSVYGLAVKDAVEMAIEEINADGGVLGKELKLYAEDDGGDSNEAKLAYTKLASKVDFLIGEVTSGNSEIVATEAAKDKMPMLTPTATAASVTQGRPTVFRACFLDPDQGVAMANFAANDLDGVEKVAVLYDNSDDYSKGVAAAFVTQATAAGLEVVLNEGGVRANEEYNSLVSSALNQNPDAVFAPVYYETAAALISQFRDADYTGPVMGADGYDGILNVEGVVAANYNNVYFSNHYAADSTEANVQTFVNAYKAKFGTAPNALAALAYDAVYIMKAAMEAAGSTDKADVVEALASVEYLGVTGNVKFNENGDPTKSITVVKYDNGEVKYVTLVGTGE